MEITAPTFARYHLMDPEGNGAKAAEVDLLPKIRREGALAGQGWVEYDVAVPETGWYEWLLPGSVDDHDFFIDHDVHVYGGVQNKISNVWLTAGKHTLRVQRLTWTGLAELKSFTLRRSNESLASTVRVQVANNRLVLRQSESLTLDIYSGGRTAPARLTVWVKQADTNATVQTLHVALPPVARLQKQNLSIPLAHEGIFYVSFGDTDAPISPDDLREIQFVVIDTHPQPRPGGDLHKTLLKEIDCSQEPPAEGFYSGGGATQVVKTPFGSYRESGDHGYLQNPNDPSFFAYNLDVPEPQQPYLIEVDYPDDALRTFCIGIEERNMMDYPPAGGVDSGGEFSLSHAMHTQQFIHWPRGKELRIVLFNAQTGRRAAAARIRLYRIDGGLPALKVPVTGGRSFGYWIEEGDRWATFSGAPDKTLEGHLLSMNRWAQAAAYMGADTLAPTLAIYQAVLYPSQSYNGYFRVNGGSRDPMPLDVTRMLLLICEKYGLKLLPDFHPTWNGYKRKMVDDAPYAALPDPKPHLLVAQDGKVGDGPFRPYFNPLYPANQDWYSGMIGEFVDRYKDSPALRGVDLRVMSWVWESWNGIPSIHWGYEDYTIALFQKETGITIPAAVDDPLRFKKRHDWLMANARDEWISWRCEKITALYARLRDRVRQARPDLMVYATVHGPQLDVGYDLGDEYIRKIDREGFTEGYRESGFDPALLSKLDGVEFLNAQHYYGRRQNYGEGSEFAEQLNRDYLLNPEALGVFRSTTGPVGFQFSNSYFEANQVVLPEKFGLPGVKPTGFVGVVNPAGWHYLERYALALAEDDASLILDGGEGYLLGQAPYLREFLIEYRHLPPLRFTPRPDARDPVAVWELKRPRDLLFYAVNRERFPVDVQFRLQGQGKVFRLANGQEAQRDTGGGNRLHLALHPYQLIAFKAEAGITIASITVTVPPAALAQVRAQVQWLEGLLTELHSKTASPSANTAQMDVLEAAQRTARASLDVGHVWSARTGLENHKVLEIFKSLKRYPPMLRDNGFDAAFAGVAGH